MGAGKGGDVISLVSELLNCNAYEAAKQVNQICNCGVDFNAPVNKYDVEKYKQKQRVKEKFEKWKNDIDNMLLDYYRILKNDIQECELDELEKKIREFCHVESLICKLENYPLLLWKYERKKVEEVERRYKQRRFS